MQGFSAIAQIELPYYGGEIILPITNLPCMHGYAIIVYRINVLQTPV